MLSFSTLYEPLIVTYDLLFDFYYCLSEVIINLEQYRSTRC